MRPKREREPLERPDAEAHPPFDQVEPGPAAVGIDRALDVARVEPDATQLERPLAAEHGTRELTGGARELAPHAGLNDGERAGRRERLRPASGGDGDQGEDHEWRGAAGTLRYWAVRDSDPSTSVEQRPATLCAHRCACPTLATDTPALSTRGGPAPRSPPQAGARRGR